jgi:LmeA-like phospholipid-binding
MRRLAITLLVLVILLIGADFGLRFVATNRIGDAIATRLGLASAPDVSITGFPFVTQAINGQYDTISATLPPAAFGPVQNVSVSVDLLGVRIPLSDALSGNVDALTAEGGQVRMTIPVASIASAVGLPALLVESAGGFLQVSTNLTVFAQQYPVRADLTATVVDSTLELHSGGVSGDGVALPAEVSQAIGTLISLDVPLAGLPFTIARGTATVVGTDLVVNATTSALTLGAR